MSLVLTNLPAPLTTASTLTASTATIHPKPWCTTCGPEPIESTPPHLTLGPLPSNRYRESPYSRRRTTTEMCSLSAAHHWAGREWGVGAPRLPIPHREQGLGAGNRSDCVTANSLFTVFRVSWEWEPPRPPPAPRPRLTRRSLLKAVTMSVRWFTSPRDPVMVRLGTPRLW